VNARVKRNDPCPCGSRLRFKECHGKLDAGGAPPVEAIVQRALQLHQQGHVDEAVARYRQVLEADPGNAIAMHYMGMAAWHRGDNIEGERLMRESIARNANIPDFHSNLGLLLRDTKRLDEAIACFHRALEVDPTWFEAHNNLGLALEAANRFEGACEAYRSAIAQQPKFAAARQNLGRALLTMGRFAEGWEQYRWRLLAQGVLFAAPASQSPPASLAGRYLALRGEQGLGDILFFLRFAPELVARGAKLSFHGDPRLHPLLERTGHFAMGFANELDPATNFETVFVGDLPWLLGMNDPARFPPPLRVPPLPDRMERWRDRLREFGPPPYVGAAWRAGTVAPGPVRVQSKEIPAALLGQQLRQRNGRWVSVQRLPREGEHEALAQASGAPLLDASSANADLEEILALMAALDDYVGVSNANVHLRAGLGLPMQVLVPFPPEWRWGLAGNSPWFPSAEVTRQQPNGRW